MGCSTRIHYSGSEPTSLCHYLLILHSQWRSNIQQQLFTSREYLDSSPVLDGSLLLIFLVFCVVFFALFVFILCFVQQVFADISGLSILDCPFRFLQCLFIFLGFNRLGFELIIYRTRGEHLNHYNTDVLLFDSLNRHFNKKKSHPENKTEILLKMAPSNKHVSNHSIISCTSQCKVGQSLHNVCSRNVKNLSTIFQCTRDNIMW